MTEVRSVHDATKLLFERYAAMLEGVVDNHPDPDRPTGLKNARWMCATALEQIDAFPVDKLSRWLGFVQGILTVEGITTVNAERDFSRPLFHAAYAHEGQAIPPTRNMPTSA